MIFLGLFLSCMTTVWPFAFVCIYPFRNSLKFSKKQTVWITTLFLILMSSLFSLTYLLPESILPFLTLSEKILFSFQIFRLACILFYVYIVQEIWQKKLFTFLFILIYSNIIFVIVVCIEQLTENVRENFTHFLASPFSYIITLLITAVTMPFALQLLNRFYLPVSDSVTPKEHVNLCAVSGLLFLLLRDVSLVIVNSSKSTIDHLLFYTTLVTTAHFSYLVIFKILFYAKERLVAQQNYSNIQHQLALKEKQYQHIHENIKNSQRIRHDFRHHMVSLQGFLKLGHIQKAEEYINQFIRVLDASLVLQFCKNKIVNTVVGYYNEMAKESNIEFNALIDLPKDIHIQDIDISIVIGNLLENAIEAAEYAKGENRYIKLNIIHSGHMISITVDNGYHDHLRKVDNQYLSTKQGQRGIGLQSVVQIAEKYNGGVEFRHDSTVFYSSVLLGVDD